MILDFRVASSSLKQGVEITLKIRSLEGREEGREEGKEKERKRVFQQLPKQNKDILLPFVFSKQCLKMRK